MDYVMFSETVLPAAIFVGVLFVCILYVIVLKEALTTMNYAVQRKLNSMV
jgi:hypothetical protein